MISASLGERVRGRLILLTSAFVLEGMALCLWPETYLLDSSDSTSQIGSMFLARYPALAGILPVLKNGVDGIFPGALWTWEHVVAFLFHAFMAGMVAYAIAAWAALRHGGDLKLRWVLIPLMVFQLTLFAMPASMTTDIFNYALYGEMPVLYGANPFVRTPAEFPQSPLYYMIPLYWHDAPSVYGPAWVAISSTVATVFRGSPLADEILSYRIIANFAHLTNAFLVWSLARRLNPAAALSATLAYAWNPLLLIEFSYNGHNDVLMLTFVLGAFLLGTYRRFRLAAIVFGLSIATKYTSVLAAPVFFVWCARTAHVGLKRQVLALGEYGVLALAPLVVLYAPWVEGPGTFGPVTYWMTGPRLKNFWPEPALTSMAAWLSSLTGSAYERTWDAVLPAFKLLAKVGLIGLIAFEAWRARSFQMVLSASARINLVFLLLVNTWLMPWYYSWPLALCAPLGWGQPIVRISAAFCLTAFLVMYQDQYGQRIVDEWGGLFMILPLVIWLLPSLMGRANSRLGSVPWRRRPLSPSGVPVSSLTAVPHEDLPEEWSASGVGAATGHSQR